MADILNNLEYLGDAVEKALRRELLGIAGAAKKLAPGKTLRRITTKVEREPDGSLLGTVGTNVAYAAYVEFGTGPVGAAAAKNLPPGVSVSYRADGWTYRDPKTGKFFHTNGQPPNPFLYPAWAANRDRLRKNVANAVRSAIRS
jgi:HK97 gp10 family phage protein